VRGGGDGDRGAETAYADKLDGPGKSPTGLEFDRVSLHRFIDCWREELDRGAHTRMSLMEGAESRALLGNARQVFPAGHQSLPAQADEPCGGIEVVGGQVIVDHFTFKQRERCAPRGA
jgi:hypothetical protein